MKILYGIPTTAKTRIEKAVAFALSPLEVNVTLGDDGSTIIFDKTAAEVYEAISAGRMIKILTELTTGSEGEETVTHVTKFCTMESTKMDTESTTVYDFVYSTVDNEDGAELYVSDAIAADAPVVLTKVA
jgi:hypothetical protein